MNRVGLHARGLSILGVFICVLMLTGVSCGAANAMSAVSKSVSMTYYVLGLVRCDHDDLGTWMDDGDHPEQNFFVFYKIEGDSTTYSTQTDENGFYTFTRGEDVYVDVWTLPAMGAPHWVYYYRDVAGHANWDDPDPVVRVARNGSAYVSFIGSDHTE